MKALTILLLSISLAACFTKVVKTTIKAAAAGGVVALTGGGVLPVVAAAGTVATIEILLPDDSISDIKTDRQAVVSVAKETINATMIIIISFLIITNIVLPFIVRRREQKAALKQLAAVAS